MNFQPDKRYFRICLYGFLTVSALLLFWQGLSHFNVVRKFLSNVGGLLAPFFYGFMIAFILAPVLRFFEVRLLQKIAKERLSAKGKRYIGILLTYTSAVAFIAILLRIVLPEVANSLTTLVNRALGAASTYENWLPSILSFLPKIEFNEQIMNILQGYAASVAQQLYDLFTGQLLPGVRNLTVNIASGTLQVVVGIIISIYFLADKERFRAGIKRTIYALVSRSSADWCMELTADCNQIFSGFIVGKIVDSMIIGILCFIGMSILQMPSIMLVSVIVGVTNVIPYFGPFIGAIPSFFIILIDDPFKSLIFLIFILALQQFDGNILGPKILGDSTGLSAFWVIFAITLFGGLFGFMGMFLGVPVMSVLMVLYKQFLKFLLKKRQMPLGLRSYGSPDSPFFSEKDDVLYPRKHQVSDKKIHYVTPIPNQSSKSSEPSEPSEPSDPSQT